MRTSIIPSRPILAAIAVLATSALPVGPLGAGPSLAGDAYLGITMSNLTASMSRALKLDDGQGVLVDSVVAGSPAATAGLQTGDVVLKIGDEQLSHTRDLSRLLRERAPGDEVRLTVLREGKQRRLQAVLGERPQRKVDGRGNVFEDGEIWRWIGRDEAERQKLLQDLGLPGMKQGFLGVEIADADPAEASVSGARITVIVPEGPAAGAGLLVGDVIVAYAGKDLANAATLREHLAATKPGDEAKLRYVRDGKRRDVTVTLGEMPARYGIAESIRRFLPGEGFDGSFRFWSGDSMRVPRPPMPPRPHMEREDLDELKAELDALREELGKLREELKQKRQEMRRE